MKVQEASLSFWARPPDATEERRCENAEKSIRNAIRASNKLSQRDIKVFTQGSYRNRVNVRQNSDVDVGVLCNDTFFYDTSSNRTGISPHIIPATYRYSQFKDEVEEALVNYFGRSAVKRGNKAFDIKENSYHVEADVAPFFQHRRYISNDQYHLGVELCADDGTQVINWPDQHYDNAVDKNNQTRRAFKGIVRIIKHLVIDMDGQNIRAAHDVPGFLLECMAYNTPNRCYGYNTWSQCLREVLVFMFNNTLSEAGCKSWMEVSELKWLFSSDQKWTREQAHSCIGALRNFLGLE